MSDASTLGRLLASARQRLQAAGIDTAAIDARLLLEAATGVGRLDMVTASDRPVAADASARLDDYLDRRLDGEPIGRILATGSFYGLDFALGPDTLEPRADTETLVEAALAAVRSGRIPGAAPDGGGLRLLDIGTGTGAIAIALLTKLPRATGLATDIAAGAIAVARTNAARHGVADRLDFAVGDLFAPVSGRFGLVLSNPPYIATEVIAGLDREVRLHDPVLALDGGADGLEAYRRLTADVRSVLLPGALVAVEIGYDQAAAVKALFETAGLTAITIHRDLGQRDRVVEGILAGQRG